jgi:hypothetical protein
MSIVPGVKITSLMASAANGDTYGDAERKIFRGIQTLVMPNVISIFGNTPPVGPVNGQTYVVGSAPTGVWAGQANAIAYWANDPQDGVVSTPQWEFYTPQVGWTAFNQATGSLIQWNGTTWGSPLVIPNKTIINPATGAIVFNAALGNSFVADLTGNVSFTITNPTDGQVISVLWVQNATGGWTVTYPGNVHSIGFVGGAGVVSPVDLQLATADAYAILGTTVTNTGSSVITGGNIGATTYTPGALVLTSPAVVVGPPVPAQAETDLGNAITFYNGLPVTTVLTTADIGTSGTQHSVGAPNGNWYAGVYKSPSSIAINSNVVLDGQGNPNAVFVFIAQSSTITQATNTTISLINGAQAANVVWVLTGGGGSFTSVAPAVTVGDILAGTSITLGGGTLTGRALASTAVTISSATNITVPGAVPGGAFHAQPSPFPNSVSSQSFTYNAATTTWYQTALGTYGL